MKLTEILTMRQPPSRAALEFTRKYISIKKRRKLSSTPFFPSSSAGFPKDFYFFFAFFAPLVGTVAMVCKMRPAIL